MIKSAFHTFTFQVLMLMFHFLIPDILFHCFGLLILSVLFNILS